MDDQEKDTVAVTPNKALENDDTKVKTHSSEIWTLVIALV